MLAEEGQDQGCVVEFKELQIAGNVKAFCQQNQSVVPSEVMTREMILCV